MTGTAQAAAIRRRIRIPLRFADGYSTTATAVSFTGLTDITKHGGYLLYLRQEGRGIGLYDKLGAERIVLLSNNPDKSAQLARLGITIASQVPTALHLTETNAAYLTTKAQRGGHELLLRGFE